MKHPMFWASALVVGSLLGAWAGLATRPAPAQQPIPAVESDTGWHEALDIYGDLYFIDLPYSDMNDSQRDDANRFARLYPEGKE